MTKEEILHLGNLSRIKLSDPEVDKLNGEIDAILDYVGTIDEIVAAGDLTKQVGPIHNVFREDKVTNEPGSYTKDIVAAFPKSKDNYLEVEKILSNE